MLLPLPAGGGGGWTWGATSAPRLKCYSRAACRAAAHSPPAAAHLAIAAAREPAPPADPSSPSSPCLHSAGGRTRSNCRARKRLSPVVCPAQAPAASPTRYGVGGQQGDAVPVAIGSVWQPDRQHCSLAASGRKPGQRRGRRGVRGRGGRGSGREKLHAGWPGGQPQGCQQAHSVREVAKPCLGAGGACAQAEKGEMDPSSQATACTEGSFGRGSRWVLLGSVDGALLPAVLVGSKERRGDAEMLLGHTGAACVAQALHNGSRPVCRPLAELLLSKRTKPSGKAPRRARLQ